MFKQLMDKTSIPRTWRVHGKGVMNNLGGILEIQADITIRKPHKQNGRPAGSAERREICEVPEAKMKDFVMNLVIMVGSKYIITTKTSRPEHGAPKNMPVTVLDVIVDDEQVRWNHHRNRFVVKAEHVQHVVVQCTLSSTAKNVVFPDYPLPPGVIVVSPLSDSVVAKVTHQCKFRGTHCIDNECKRDGKRSKVHMTVNQIPLVSAKVISIHKSEGQTYPDGITLASLEGHGVAVPSETLYVALSRSPTSAGASSLIQLTDADRWKPSLLQRADSARLKVNALKMKLRLI